MWGPEKILKGPQYCEQTDVVPTIDPIITAFSLTLAFEGTSFSWI